MDEKPSRKLLRWELDKYWLRVARLAISESWEMVLGEPRWRAIMIPAATAAIAALFQFLIVGWSSGMENLKIVGTSLGAGLFLFVVLAVLSAVRKPCELDVRWIEKHSALEGKNAELEAELTRLRAGTPTRQPRVAGSAFQVVDATYDNKDGIWREGGSEHPYKAYVLHFTNSVHEDGKGASADNLRAQIFWEYNHNPQGPTFSPAAWLDELYGVVEIQAGCSKKLLIGIKTSNYWDGYSNLRTKPGDKHPLHSQGLPYDGTMKIRVIGKNDETLCESKWEWKEDLEHSSRYPILTQLS